MTLGPNDDLRDLGVSYSQLVELRMATNDIIEFILTLSDKGIKERLRGEALGYIVMIGIKYDKAEEVYFELYREVRRTLSRDEDPTI